MDAFAAVTGDLANLNALRVRRARRRWNPAGVIADHPVGLYNHGLDRASRERTGRQNPLADRAGHGEALNLDVPGLDRDGGKTRSSPRTARPQLIAIAIRGRRSMYDRAMLAGERQRCRDDHIFGIGAP